MTLLPRSRRFQVLVVTMVILAAALACGVAAALAESPSPGTSGAPLDLRMGWTTEPDNLNPFIGWANSTYEVWAINYSQLFGYGLDVGERTLDLAREWPTKDNGGISPDGKVWTIKLRQGVKWSDGQAFSADDVAFTINYIVKNQMLNMAVSTLFIESAKALAPDVVQVTCSKPKADMLNMFLPILPKHVWENVDPKDAQNGYVNKPPIVGTGPFYTTEFKKGTDLIMERNPYYYGKKPTLDRLVFLMYQNADTMTADLKSGNIDAAWGIPPAQFDALSSDPNLKPVAYNFLSWDYLSLNCYTGTSLGNPVLKDWRFRNALNYAVDRQRLCDTAYAGKATPGTTILPPDQWKDPDYHWQPPADQLYPFDLDKANQLLDEAGYKRGADGLRQYQGKPIKLRLWATTEETQSQAAGKLVAGWFQKLGLKIDFSVLETGALEARIWNFQGNDYIPDFDMYIWNWAGYSDPGQTLSAETTAQIGNTNEPCWSNAEYDKLNNQQASELDVQTRLGYIDQMQQVMYEQTPWVVLVYPQYLQAYNTAKWTGWVQMMDGKGPAFYTTGNLDSYLELQPKAVEASSSNTSIWIVVVIATVAVVVLVVWLVRRRRPRAEEA